MRVDPRDVCEMNGESQAVSIKNPAGRMRAVRRLTDACLNVEVFFALLINVRDKFERWWKDYNRHATRRLAL